MIEIKIQKKKIQLKLKLTFNMATGITAEAIQQMIQEALAAQAEAHRKELAAQAAHFQTSSAVPTPPSSPTNSSTRSTVPRGIRLNMGSPSSVLYNGLGGTSTSAMSQAAVGPASALASASSSSVSTQEDFYKLLTLDLSKNEKSLNERNEDPVTDSGLVTSLKFFDEYNHLGGRRSLREFLGHVWLRTLERVQGVSIPHESDGASALRHFLDSVFHSPDSFNIRVETDFVAVKLELLKGRVSLDAMQSYAARFAAILDDWVSCGIAIQQHSLVGASDEQGRRGAGSDDPLLCLIICIRSGRPHRTLLVSGAWAATAAPRRLKNSRAGAKFSSTFGAPRLLHSSFFWGPHHSKNL